MAGVDPTPIEPLEPLVIAALRRSQVEGISRRTLLRGSLAAALGLVVTEALAGTLGFLWPSVAGLGGRLAVGTLDDLERLAAPLPVREGFPGYVAEARAFVVLVVPAIGRFLPGADATGTGTGVNVIALSQRCPHLGCRPNPCIEDYWFHCPCHQSRYDRLGIKAAGELFGPAPRGMDRYATEVSAAGVLTVVTSKITLGPLPVALGQPGIIPPRTERGCA